jgi:hypothetical protein
MNRASFIAAAAAFSMMPTTVSAEGAGFAFDQITELHPMVPFDSCESGDFASQWAAFTRPDFGTGPDARRRLVEWSQQYRGIAETHFVTATKWRSKLPSGSPDYIVDFAARRVTTMNRWHHTYQIDPLEKPSTERNAYARKVLADYSSASLSVFSEDTGSYIVFGCQAEGYRYRAESSTVMAGQRHDVVVNVKKLLSPFPRTRKVSDGVPVIFPYGFSSLLDATDTVILAARTGEMGSSVSFSGPPIPLTLAYFEAVSLRDVKTGSTMTSVVKRGNFRPISDDDPAFTVSPEYTLTQS